MMKKRKIWKSIGSIILLLMFHVDAIAAPIEHHYDGLDITFNDDGTAVVSLSTSGAISANLNWPNFILLLQWDQMSSIQFKSVNGASYSSDDWNAIASIINKATLPESKTVALDFSGITIADNLFSFQGVTYKSKITSVVMPNGLTTLADGAFNGCTSLNNVGWSPALTSIGATAFYNTGFTSITIPEGVTSIGSQAFAFCKSLGSITFPATLQTVGADVIEKSPVIALYSRSLTPPEVLGDFCTAEDPAAYNSAYNWNFGTNEFDFYSHCILYVEPTTAVLKAYSEAPYWHKFFIKGVVKIYLRPTDLQRPQVSGVQQLEVVSEHVNDGTPTTFTINTVYVRSMDSSKWYTIMLPFPVSNAKLKEVFGENTQVWGYSGVYDNTLCFDEPVTEAVPQKGMEADIPYLIKPGVGKGEYEFNGEDVDYTPFNESPSLAVAGGQKGTEQYTSTYQGTYTNQKIPTYAYYLKNNLFYYMPSENTTLGWKAYGGIVYVSDESNVESGSNVLDLAVGHSGDASVIESYQMETKASDQLLYNLAGQQVRQPQRGIYVRNGKKIIIK